MTARRRIVVLISGSGSNLQALIDACAQDQLNADIVGVLSNKADAYGLVRAANANIVHAVLSHKDYASREEYDRALVAKISEYQPDLVVLAGFMRILTPYFVQQFFGRLVNIHPSLLPKYQGLNTHQRALDAGDDVHGASVHFVTEELDGGPVIVQGRVTIEAIDTADTLAAKVHQQEHVIYPLAVKWFCEGRLSMQQSQAYFDNQPLPANGKVLDALTANTH